MFKKLIGPASFYKTLLALAIPIMIQNGITNFVNMLDNIMVGSLSAPEMTAVAVCNQLFFVFNLCVFGMVSGAGIFGSQFFGKEDFEGLKHTFRFKILSCSLLAALCIFLFLFFGKNMVMLYLTGEGSPEDIAATIEYAKQYISIMVIGFIPVAITQSFSSTLRETGRTRLPMYASLAAVIVNLTFNYLLIYGSLGFPRLGVKGAAIATVLGQIVAMFLAILLHHKCNKEVILDYKRIFRPDFKTIGAIYSVALPSIVMQSIGSIMVFLLNKILLSFNEVAAAVFGIYFKLQSFVFMPIF